MSGKCDVPYMLINSQTVKTKGTWCLPSDSGTVG